MIKINDYTYISNLDEIRGLIQQGFTPRLDLRIAIEHGLISEKDKYVKIYIDHKNRHVDIFSNVKQKDIYDIISPLYWLEDRDNVILEGIK